MEYPFTREVLEVCECERPIRNRFVAHSFCPVWSQKLIADCHSYKFSSLSYVRAALSYSTKASVRTDSNGVLSLQFMIADASGREGGYAGFVEFTVSDCKFAAATGLIQYTAGHAIERRGLMRYNSSRALAIAPIMHPTDLDALTD